MITMIMVKSCSIAVLLDVVLKMESMIKQVVRVLVFLKINSIPINMQCKYGT